MDTNIRTHDLARFRCRGGFIVPNLYKGPPIRNLGTRVAGMAPLNTLSSLPRIIVPPAKLGVETSNSTRCPTAIALLSMR